MSLSGRCEHLKRYTVHGKNCDLLSHVVRVRKSGDGSVFESVLQGCPLNGYRPCLVADVADVNAAEQRERDATVHLLTLEERDLEFGVVLFQERERLVEAKETMISAGVIFPDPSIVNGDVLSPPLRKPVVQPPFISRN